MPREHFGSALKQCKNSKIHKINFQWANFHEENCKIYFFHSIYELNDGWMNGVLGHFYALTRLNWAGDNLG